MNEPLRFAVAAVTAVVLAGCNKPIDESSPNQPRRYGIESGIIEYKLTGMQEGIEVLYWKDYGLHEAKLTVSEMSLVGVSRTVNRLHLTNPQWVYSIDLDTNSGTRSRNSLTETLADLKSAADLTRVGMELLHGAVGDKVGSMEVAGKTCDLYEIPAAATRTCVWQAVPLLTQVRMMGVSQEAVATRVDDSPSILDSRFALPEGVLITEAPDLATLRDGGAP